MCKLLSSGYCPGKSKCNCDECIRDEQPKRQQVIDMGYEGAIVFENFDYDSAIIGVTADDRVVYSYEKMVEWLMAKEGWTEEESIDWIDYNTIRALGYVGENGPVVVYGMLD